MNSPFVSSYIKVPVCLVKTCAMRQLITYQQNAEAGLDQIVRDIVAERNVEIKALNERLERLAKFINFFLPTRIVSFKPRLTTLLDAQEEKQAHIDHYLHVAKTFGDDIASLIQCADFIKAAVCHPKESWPRIYQLSELEFDDHELISMSLEDLNLINFNRDFG